MKLFRAVLITVAFAALMAPASALAAPPANDDFADREVLGPGFPGGLPIEVTRSNVEATAESGEFAQQLSPAGHSVWFEWEATATDWVSVGLCGTQFPTLIEVFTGTEVDELTSILKINGSEGPGCPGETGIKYTFKATSGTKYAIFVDGNDFTGPETVPVQTEGEFFLRIEETQPPANDDFADAEPLIGQIGEEPGGNRIYSATLRGNNWAATTEPGEPSYEAGAGASAWFEWTVPVNGTYTLGPCCGAPLKWGLYSGDSLGGLTELFLGTGFTARTLTPGTNLKIVVFGAPDGATGEPTMGSFSLLVRANLPPLPQPPGGGGTTVTPPPPPPAAVPETKVTSRLLKHRIGLAKFRFASTVAGSSFQCKLDKGQFKPCKSPKAYKRLKPGRHTFKVKAISPDGIADPSAWVGRFLIAEPPQR